MNYLEVRLVAAALGLGLVAGCGLISSDVTNFDLTLPEKKFTIDAAAWPVDTARATSLFGPDGKLLGVPCSSMTVCSAAVAQACSTDCSGSCNTTSNTCEMSLDVSKYQMINLVTEQPSLKTVSDQPVIKVTIDSVTYQVTNNSLNVATPELRVYVAATSVVKLPVPIDASSGVKLVGTIPSIPAGSTNASAMALMFSPTGKATLIDTMNHFKTPFNILVGSSLLVTSGQPLPAGKLDAVVQITAHAGI